MIDGRENLKGKAKEAFNRTSPHPADPRVRLTDNPDDLVAIHCEGVSAVIWQREMPEEIKGTLDVFDDLHRVSTDGYTVDTSKASDVRTTGIPALLAAEMKMLAQLFIKVSRQSTGQVREMVNFQASDCEKNLYKYGVYLPHVDGFLLRMGTVFSKAARMGTQWYPQGAATGEWTVGKSLDTQEIPDIKNEQGLEQIETGHVVIFKGLGRSVYPVNELFSHSAPLPTPGVVRVGYFVGCY